MQGGQRHRCAPFAHPTEKSEKRAKTMTAKTTCDVIVIGGGSAALEAAIAAKKAGAESVIMVEKAPKHESGGNAQFSHVGFRFVHSGRDELREFMPQVP